jgi:hypothetical protein
MSGDFAFQGLASCCPAHLQLRFSLVMVKCLRTSTEDPLVKTRIIFGKLYDAMMASRQRQARQHLESFAPDKARRLDPQL